MAKDLFPGLPDEVQDLLDDVDKSYSKVEIKVERRKYGKFWAIVSGIDQDKLKTILKTIKNKMACGGTIKEKNLEILFGKSDKTSNLIEILVKEGFQRDSIHVSS